MRSLLAAADARPGVVQLEVFGQSVRGQPLVAVHVVDPATPPREEVLVIAGLHALEWIGSECAWELLDRLVVRPIPGVRVTVIPVMNPDGRDDAERMLDEGRWDAYRRGNDRLVDLNRDFATHRDARALWRHLLPDRFATSPGALSQPESAALDALLGRHRYVRAASLHSFGGYLYHPWAGRWSRPDDWAEHVRVGRAMERAMGAGAYRTRQLGRWGFFFRAQGAEIDHLYAEHGIISFLIEVTRSGITRPADLDTPFRWYNPRRPGPHVRRTVDALFTLARSTPTP